MFSFNHAEFLSDFREFLDCFFNIFFYVSGEDLHATARFAFGNDGKRKTGDLRAHQITRVPESSGGFFEVRDESEAEMYLQVH